MEKAFRTVSLRLEAKTEVLGSVDHKFGVVVDEASTGGVGPTTGLDHAPLSLGKPSA